MVTKNIKQLYEDKQKTKEAYPRVWLPIGSLYWNENDISEDISKYFAGTWEQIKDVFILAAGDIYQTKTSGGEATHILTIDEMPSHTHDAVSTAGSNSSVNLFPFQMTQQNHRTVDKNVIRPTGGGQAHNNMPPYYCVYCWKRIS